MPSEAAPSPERKDPPAGRKFPCVKCGARLDFDPHSQALKCPYCGHAEVIAPGRAELVERDLEEYLARESGAGVVEGLTQELRCATCAAVVLVQDKVAADRCPYCGTFLENKAEPARPMVVPEGLLPFAIDQKKAIQNFGDWLHGLWFAPSALKRAAEFGRLLGVYIPFWTFDSMTYSWYRGQRGDDYQETEYYTAQETYLEDGQTKTRDVTKTRQVTKTRWSSVSGEVRHFFDDVLICASGSLPEHYAEAITPEELKSLEVYKAEYVSGFTAERYSVGPKDGFEKARGVMEVHIRHLVCRAIGGDHQTIEHLETQHTGVTFKHVLLPVWLASYRFREKTYHAMVNGRTGQVLGDRPYSWVKITALVAGIVAAVGAVVWLVWSLTS